MMTSIVETKYIVIYPLIILSILALSCEREWNNPYDPDVELPPLQISKLR